MASAKKKKSATAPQETAQPNRERRHAADRRVTPDRRHGDRRRLHLVTSTPRPVSTSRLLEMAAPSAPPVPPVPPRPVQPVLAELSPDQALALQVVPAPAPVRFVAPQGSALRRYVGWALVVGVGWRLLAEPPSIERTRPAARQTGAGRRVRD